MISQEGRELQQMGLFSMGIMFALSTHVCKCQLSKERKNLSVP